MYSKIINPVTGRKVSIYGKIGKKIINNYLNQLGGKASPCAEFHGKPLKCNSYSKDGVDCVYSAAKVKGKVGQCRKSSARDIEKSRESARRRNTIEKQFQKSSLDMLKQGLSKKKLKQRLKKIDNCKKCATRVSNIQEWNKNNCNDCIDLEDELHFFTKSRDNYFKLRQDELETFDNEILPKLGEIFDNDSTSINSYITKNYSYGEIETYSDFFKSITKGYKSFLNKFRKMAKEYDNIKKSLPTNIKVYLAIDYDEFYYYNINTEQTSYNLEDL